MFWPVGCLWEKIPSLVPLNNLQTETGCFHETAQYCLIILMLPHEPTYKQIIPQLCNGHNLKFDCWIVLDKRSFPVRHEWCANFLSWVTSCYVCLRTCLLKGGRWVQNDKELKETAKKLKLASQQLKHYRTNTGQLFLIISLIWYKSVFSGAFLSPQL